MMDERSPTCSTDPSGQQRLSARYGLAGAPGLLRSTGALIDLGARSLGDETELVHLVDLQRQTQLASIRLPEPARQLLLSSDGKCALAAGAGNWWLHDSAGKLLMSGRPEGPTGKPPGAANSAPPPLVAFHPDGRRFAVVGSDGARGAAALQLRSATDAADSVPLPLDKGEQGMSIHGIRFSPSGRYLAAIAFKEAAPGRDPLDFSSSRLIVWRIGNSAAIERLWGIPFALDSFSEMLPIDFAEDADRIIVASAQRPPANDGNFRSPPDDR